jgi:hypothetical protein
MYTLQEVAAITTLLSIIISIPSSSIQIDYSQISIPQIEGEYYRSSGTIILRDMSRSGSPITITGLFSGNNQYRNRPQFQSIQNNGPIPEGRYEIFNDDEPSHDGWYRLDRIDSSPRNDKDDDLTGRDGFRLHPGTLSLGCITVPSSERVKWNLLVSVIEGTKNQDGIRDKKGRLWWARNTKLTKYGTITVY